MGCLEIYIRRIEVRVSFMVLVFIVYLVIFVKI